MRSHRLRGQAAISIVAGCTTLTTLPCVAAESESSLTQRGRPIRFLVAYRPGSSDDIHARLIAEKLPQLLGRNVIVDNRASAGGVLGFELGSRGAPDGSTILMAGANLTLLPYVRKELAFDPKAFTPISQVSTFQLALVVYPGLPARNVQDLVKLAREKPGEIRFGSSGVGATPHLSAELFKSMTKIDMRHIPYKSGALLDVMAGRIEMIFSVIPSSVTFIREGKLRALGVTGSRRSPHFPDVPTIAEAGVPGYELTSWFSVVGPPKMSAATVATLNAAIRQAVAMPDVTERLVNSAVEPHTSTPQELALLMEATRRKFAQIVRAAGIEPE